MKFVSIIVSIAALIFTGLPVPAMAQGLEQPADKLVLGFYTVYYSGDRASYESLAANGSYMNDISVKTFTVDSLGNVHGSTPADAVSYARSNGIGAFAAVTNEYNEAFDPNIAHSILVDTVLRQKVIDQLVTMAVKNGYSGINLDFENMFAADRGLYSRFVKELTDALHAKGLKLIVSVMAKTADCADCEWSGTIDYASLGQHADYVQIMTYEQHGAWGAPGPVAGADWVESVLKYATSLIPAGKILIGLPAYGYDWNVTTGTGHKPVAWKYMPKLLAAVNAVPKWDAASQSPYFSYTAGDGAEHTVWYENAKSIAAKTALVNKYAIAGAAAWCLRLEDAGFWQAVRRGLQTRATASAPATDALFTSVLTNKPSFTGDDIVYMSVKVKDANQRPVAGAIANMIHTNPNGKVTVYSGTTDANGKALFIGFTSGRTIKGTYNISVNVTHPQYNGRTGAAAYEVK
ncbi:glycosyl hydrolase family 18 protein [Paenibacillus thermotolerans]|uniref:glycosyl hydrolase family 18 protein n=1 Tax=Paenibacillus thermotolerans TaxID=3027807 RepID=UPI00236859C6|nr:MULTISPECIES: glycosyl hydrolase family 18 protein [unclassified Paenibacillus]